MVVKVILHYNQSQNWKCGSENQFYMCIGNFTQMIWRSTEQVGVGLASDGKGKFITVAFYKPPGNITNPGYFKDNVKPAGRWSIEYETLSRSYAFY